MNKTAFVFIIFALVLGFAACSSDNAPKPPPSVSTAELAELVRETVTFPAMVEHTGEDIETFIGLKLGYAEEITVFQQALTMHLVEIIIVRPEEGSMSNIMQFLQDRQAHLKEISALYPMQQAAVEAMVVGSKSGFAYLICHEDAPAAEKALSDFLSQ